MGQLHGRMEFIKLHYLRFLREHGAIRRGRSSSALRKGTGSPGICVDKDTICFVDSEPILSDPVRLIKVFEESARLRLPLNMEARRLVREFSYLVDDAFRSSKPVVKSFERILVTYAPTFNVLNEMLNTGFLVALIPELAALSTGSSMMSITFSRWTSIPPVRPDPQGHWKGRA